MKSLIIRNFGPVKQIDIKLDKDINLLIGAQASGKSTIGKTIYCCRKIRDYLTEYVMDPETLAESKSGEWSINF